MNIFPFFLRGRFWDKDYNYQTYERFVTYHSGDGCQLGSPLGTAAYFYGDKAGDGVGEGSGVEILVQDLARFELRGHVVSYFHGGQGCGDKYGTAVGDSFESLGESRDYPR